MKTDLFNSAISQRTKIRFLYNLESIIIEPYYLSISSGGNKVIYGRVNNTNEIRMFEYGKIFNIKVLNNKKFSPIIPILPIYN